MDFFKKLVSSHFSFGISRLSANLAYYLMFSLFPFLLFVNSLFGIMKVNIDMLNPILEFVPTEIVNILSGYLDYLKTADNLTPFFVGLILTLYSFARFVNSLFYAINEVYGHNKPKKTFITSIFFTLSLMASIYVLLILVVAGGFIVDFLEKIIHIPEYILALADPLRYAVSAAYFFFIILMLYKNMPKKHIKIKEALPGTFFTIISIFIISIGFSYYISNFSNYSVVYGSLSAVMILMLWLYLTSMIIVHGALINKLIIDRKNAKA